MPAGSGNMRGSHSRAHQWNLAIQKLFEGTGRGQPPVGHAVDEDGGTAARRQDVVNEVDSQGPNDKAGRAGVAPR